MADYYLDQHDTWGTSVSEAEAKFLREFNKEHFGNEYGPPVKKKTALRRPHHGNTTFEYAPGKFVTNVHDRSACQNQDHCVVHHPSNHHMRHMPLHWRQDRYMFERTCPHGIGHPDPDHMTWFEGRYGKERAAAEGTHGCDGCCDAKTVKR